MNKTYRIASQPHSSRRKTRAPSLNPTTKDVVTANQQSQPLESDQFILGSYKVSKSDLLGKGFCSKVYKAIHTETNQLYAFKLIDLQQIKSVVHRRFLKNQIECLKKLRNQKHIIHLVQIIQNKTHLAIVTQICRESLSQMMKSKDGYKRPLQIHQALKVFEETVLGYMAMKAEGYVHRDIKPANILISMDGTIKLCDLGFATLEQKINQDRFVNVGSPLYMAPQTLKENCYSTKADIWALGLVLLEMLNGKLPWEDVKQANLRNFILATKFQDIIPKGLDLKWKVMLLHCLEADPKRRCNALQLIQYIKPQYEASEISHKKPQLFAIKKQRQSPMEGIQVGFQPRKQSTTVTTAHTQLFQQKTSYPQRIFRSSQNSREKIASLEYRQNVLPVSLRVSNPYSKPQRLIRLNSNSHSSNQQPIKPQTSDLIALKLSEPNSSNAGKAKKQYMAHLNLIRVMFQTVELLFKAQGNLHCTYLNISQNFMAKIASNIVYLFSQLRIHLIEAMRNNPTKANTHKELKNLRSLVQQYERNYLEYFSIKLGLKATLNGDIEELIVKMSQHSAAGQQHFRLVIGQILQSNLSQITDRQICQFLTLMDNMHCLISLLKLRVKNIVGRGANTEQLLRRGKDRLSIEEIRKMGEKLFSR